MKSDSSSNIHPHAVDRHVTLAQPAEAVFMRQQYALAAFTAAAVVRNAFNRIGFCVRLLHGNSSNVPGYRTLPRQKRVLITLA